MPENAYPCDLLIMFATSTEQDELRKASKARGIDFAKRTVDTTEGKYAFYTLGQIGTFRVNAIRSDMGPFGHGGSAARAIRSLQIFGAVQFVQYGMAFGTIPREQKLGDVLVSRALFPYDRRRIFTPGNRTKPWNRPYRVDYIGTQAYPASETLLPVFLNETVRGGRDYAISTGILLSGSARIHSRRFRDELVRSIPVGDERVVGGEMEACGLLSVCPIDSPNWIVIKGISDFADEHRDRIIEDTRSEACRNAASFILDSTTVRKPPPIPFCACRGGVAGWRGR